MQEYELELSLKVGCAVNCVHCPQTLFLSKYTSKKREMTLRDYKKYTKTFPKDKLIAFAGFSEPFGNKDAFKIIKYAIKEGRKIDLFTTLEGLNIEQTIELCKISDKLHYICIHVMDKHNHTLIKNTDEYYTKLKIVKQLMKNYKPITLGFYDEKARKVLEIKYSFTDYIMRVLFKISEILGYSSQINSRAGNLKIGKKYDHTFKKIKCKLNIRPIVLPNGDAVLCCNDYGMRHILGNLNKVSYFDLFKGEEYKDVLNIMQFSDDGLLCNRCEVAEVLK